MPDRKPIIPTSELDRMVYAAMDGQPYDPPTPEAAALWPKMRADVYRILDAGMIVEIPFDP